VQLEPGGEWREIVVPFTFEAPLSGIGAGAEVRERIRYRRTFRVPDEWRARTLLHFGAVDWRATVTLDGDVLGTHEGGYSHFWFDAGRLAPGGEHKLVVDVLDPAADAFGQAKGKQRGSHEIWYTRTTGIWRSVCIEGVPDEYIRDVNAFRDAIEIAHPRLWSPGDPFLYDVELRLGDDALRADVVAAKALGFNLVRKHVKVEDPRWYSWCDRLGLLVAQDLPSSHVLSTPAARERLRGEWLEIIDQHRAHPSVVVWIPINEDWGKPPPDFQRELVRATRNADPTRLVVDASGWNQLEDTDLVDVHDYGAELTKHRGARDDIPLWFGECGGISLEPEGFVYRTTDDLAAGYRALVDQIPRDAAGFVWTQLADVETERNGLLTADRRPKTDPAAIRAVNEAFLGA
jgi:beta-galactosidase/beta-glucuronidase